ncbi:MAG: hypothetical protein HY240_00015 [Actinobacteria bacterium]|nr:hypothetical protein [Actinomycetota bacterium]
MHDERAVSGDRGGDGDVGNPWAVLAIAAALLPFGLGIVLGGAGRFGLSSNAAERIVFGSVPVGGLVAVMAGITG